MLHPTPFDWLSIEGRLKRQLKQALMEQNLNASLDSLRQVQQQLKENPDRFAHLWLPFLDTLLDTNRVRYLTPNDLLAVEEMGKILTNHIETNIPPEEIWWRVVKAYD